MKKLIVFFGFLMVPVFFGCQENQVLVPAEDNADQNLTKNEIINLCCPLMDPNSGQCAIRGKISYVHEVLGVSHYNLTNVRVNLGIEINAEIMSEAHQIGPPSWTVLASSQQSFFIKNMETSCTLNKGENERLFVKHYSINNRNDVLLEIKYLVDLHGLKINGICIVPAQFSSQ